MKEKLLKLLVLPILFASCGQQQLVKAKIFERREIDDNRLIIKFNYTVKDKIYTDSATIKNQVLTTDSITVIIDPSNPTKAIPDFSAK